jgi:hypothetical protein
MVGIIVNRYSRQSSSVEIVEVAALENGGVHLVSKREFEGGKVHLNTFDSGTLQQTSETVIRGTLTRLAPQSVAA